MGIVDLFRPKHKHSDVKVRLAAVRALSADDTQLLASIARNDKDPAGFDRFTIGGVSDLNRNLQRRRTLVLKPRHGFLNQIEFEDVSARSGRHAGADR